MSDELIPREPQESHESATSATLTCAAGVAPERLSAWRDGLLLDDQAAELAAHAATCPACGARLRDYDRIGAALREQVIPRASDDPWPAMARRLAGERRGSRLPSTPRSRTWGGLGALVAAALLVALFAGLLAHQASRRPTPTSTATAVTSTTTPSTLPAAWTQIAAYSHLNGLAVAPSNPQVAYQVWWKDSSAVGNAKGGLLLRRTDDQGATWQTLPGPSIAGANYPIIGGGPLDAVVNPFDARVVFLQIPAGMDNRTAPCASNGGGDAPACVYQFISVDSGVHWQLLSLPEVGLFWALQGQRDPSAQPQDMRLYAMISGGGVGHLVESDHGGMTWRLIDGPIFATGQSLLSYAATSSGATVFALTEPTGQPATSSGPPPTIWRSDDAGATWSNLGAAPSAYIEGVRAALVANSGKPILYIMSADLGTNRTIIQGSLFGASNSFHQAPDPSCGATNEGAPALLATRQDGSVSLWCGGQIESWLALPARMDEGWRPLAQNPGVNLIPSSFVQTLPDGSERLWLVIDDNTGARVEYATLPS